MNINRGLNTTRLNLLNLPTEIILLIGDAVAELGHRDWPRELRHLNRLVRSSKRLYTTLNRKLYRIDGKRRCHALLHAAKNANVDTALRSLDAGADVNHVYWSYGVTALSHAVEKRLKKEEELDDLSTSVQDRHEKCDDMINLLILYGADFKGLTLPENNAVMLTVTKQDGALPVLQTLLENGVDVVNQQDRLSGHGPLHNVVKRLQVTNPDKSTDAMEMLRLLLNYGADPNIGDKKGVTPLHRAADIRWAKNGGYAVFERIKVLIHHGADINAVDHSGRTPLGFLLFTLRDMPYKSLHSEILKLFLEKGADTSLCRLPRSYRLREEILEICDEVSRSTGRQFEFLPGHHRLY